MLIICQGDSGLCPPSFLGFSFPGLAMWNMGVAYLAGLVLYYGVERRVLKL
jgi:hypothetical protein